MEFSSRIERELLPFINKPGRFTGNEYNVVIKNLDDVQLRVALAFPELYELGMSYVGFEILYHVLNSRPEIWAERVYAPWFDAEEVLREKKIPLFSLESRTPLREFDWIGFTLQYELTYTNLLNMLELSGIPLYARDRNENDPFVIGGGPAASNPEPIADFMDAILIGDGEEAVLEISEVILQARKEGVNRQETLLRLSRIPGMYVPGFYRAEYNEAGEFRKIVPLRDDVPRRIVKRILPELDRKNYPMRPLVPLIEVTHDRLSVEIMRGCTEGCRFCNAGMIYRPVRERPVEDIVEQTRRAIAATGFNEVSLLSLNTSDYQQLSWLMMKEKMLLAQQNVKFSFPSLRLDGLTPEMVDFVKTFKKTGFTFAPEAGSQRLRDVINKNIREDDLLDSLRLILDNGWQMVKFYFMIGLPTETDADVEAIADLVLKCREIASGYRDVRINVSISPFSPKAHTPFQWERQDLPVEVDRKIHLIAHRLNKSNIHLTWRDGHVTSLETIFARGGRELAPALELAWRHGARFDGWNEGFNWDTWLAVFEELGIDWKSYLRPISTHVPLPWDHIDMGITRSFLLKERNRAYQGHITPDCKDKVCIGCGLQRKEFEKLVSCYRQTPHQRGAERVNAPSAPATPATHAPATISYGRGRKRRQVGVQMARKKIRVQYTKTGQMRFLSHLDIARVIERAARRANIALVYSQGFTPRPKISFGPPLVLGVASIAEYLDVEVDIGREADLTEKLNLVLPPGMQFVRQKTVFAKVPALAAVINWFEYETFLEDFNLPDEWITEWLARETIVVERETRKGVKTVDIRPFVADMKVVDDRLQIAIHSVEGRMAKINEVLESLFAEKGIDYRQFLTQRTGQFVMEDGVKKDPFQILALELS